jgi:uncharacterized cupredoxin-like copper-binding protein
MLEQADWRVPAMAAGALALAVAGCGGGSSYSNPSQKTTTATGAGPYATQPAPAAAGQQVKLSADPDGSLYFVPKKLSAKAGAVTLVLTNPKTTGKQHGIGVKGNGVDKDGTPVQPGGTSTISVTLKPGKYTFYCTFDGHAKAGMKGTLTVQ